MSRWKPWMSKLLQILVAVLLPGGLLLVAGWQAVRLASARTARTQEARALLASR
jgi:hypothetical protein